MAIIIRPLRAGRIAVTGDIVTTLRRPDTGIEDRFWIATSDGSRLLGTPARGGGTAFRLIDEGAALVTIGPDGVSMEWRMEWITIAGFYDGAHPVRHRSGHRLAEAAA